MKIVFRGHAHIMGSDFAYLEEVPDDTTESHLSDIAWDYAIENANSHGEFVGEEFPEEDEENYDYITSDMIRGYWEIYDPETHDEIL